MIRRKRNIKPQAGKEGDWAVEEYGLTGEELGKAAAKLLKSGEKLLRARRVIRLEDFKRTRSRS